MKAVAWPVPRMPMPWPAPSLIVQRLDVPSAGTIPGSACSMQPKTTSGSMWPMVERATTAAGCGALTIVFSGAVTRIASSVPALFGMRGATTHFTPKEV